MYDRWVLYPEVHSIPMKFPYVCISSNKQYRHGNIPWWWLQIGTICNHFTRAVPSWSKLSIKCIVIRYPCMSYGAATIPCLLCTRVRAERKWDRFSFTMFVPTLHRNWRWSVGYRDIPVSLPAFMEGIFADDGLCGARRSPFCFATIFWFKLSAFSTFFLLSSGKLSAKTGIIVWQRNIAQDPYRKKVFRENMLEFIVPET